MTDFYCDHGAYASALGTTPTWGVPQEGDGSSKDAATASSIASIAFASVPTSGALSVCGISIGTSGVIGAASVGAAADALAGLINAVTTTVAAGVAVGTPQLRNLVYARGPTLGAPAGTCQIMMRVGSATLNQATNALAAIASTFDGAPTLVQFAGGSGGCWGWLLNPSAMGVSGSIAVLGYGQASNKYMVISQPYVSGDICYARTGSGKTITYTTASTAISVGISQNCDYRLLFDTNTKWTGDSGTGVVLFDLSCTSQYKDCQWTFAGEPYETRWQALMKGGCKLKLSASASFTGFYLAGVGYSNGGSGVSLVNIDIEDGSNRTDTGLVFTTGTAYNYTSWLFRGCRFSRPISSTKLIPIATLSNGYSGATWNFEGCEFTWNITGAADPGPVATLTVTTNNPSFIGFYGCAFSGWPSGNNKFKILSASGIWGGNVAVENCTGVALTAAYSGISSTNGVRAADSSKVGYFMQSAEIGGPFRLEARNGVIEYDPGATPTFPLLASIQPDGTNYALRVIWFNDGKVGLTNDFSLPLEQTYKAAIAARTVTLELLIRTALIPFLNATKVSLMVSYLNGATGKMVSEFVNGVPVSSGATWTNASLYPTYEARKLSLTTSGTITPNSRLKVALFLSGSPAGGQTEVLYVDPEFSVV